MYRIRSKAVSALLLVSILGGTLFSAYAPAVAPRAQAQWAVHIVSSSAPTDIAMSAATAATAGSTFAQTTILQVLNGIAWTVAKVAVQSITKSIVNWINSGFQGSPAFVTDLQTNLRQVADAAVNQIAQYALSSATSSSSPFANEAKDAIAAYYLYSSKDAIAAQLKYSLKERVANDKAFLAGDFSQGGFNGWFGASQHPANNPFGVSQITQNAIAKKVVDSANSRLTELGWGKGFISWRGACAVAKDTSGNSILTDDFSDPNAKGPTGNVPLSDADTCAQYKIDTPGSVVESQLENQLGSGVRQLELADSINEIVGALAGQLVGAVLGGSGGLAGASAPASGGGASVLTTSTSASTYSAEAANLSAGFIQALLTQQTQLQAYQANESALHAAAAAAQTRAQSCTFNTSDTSLIAPTLDSSAIAMENASTSLATLSTLITKAKAIQSAAASDQANQLSSINSSYQVYQSLGTTPGNAAIDKAAQDAAQTESPAPPSLIMQLNQIATVCEARGVI